MAKKLFGDDETTERPVIIQIAPLLMPGAMPGTTTLAIFGLAVGSGVYMYDSKKRCWINA